VAAAPNLGGAALTGKPGQPVGQAGKPGQPVDKAGKDYHTECSETDKAWVNFFIDEMFIC
jgi:hypothetical protein